jgi:signal transduction histidine kinase
MTWQASALADRIHNGVLQHLGAAMLKAELCEHLYAAERIPDMVGPLRNLRETLEQVCLELRGVMAELRSAPTQ